MKFEECQQKLKQMEALIDGWDSYHAPAPYPSAIKEAEYCLNNFTELEPYSINPSVVGGVVITYKNGIRKAVLEIYDYNRRCLLLSDGKNIETIKNTIAVSYEAIKKYLATPPPKLTRLQVLTTEDPAELNWLIGLYVLNLPDLHYYYKRFFPYVDWKEQCSWTKCNKDEGGASPLWNSNGSLRNLPYFSTDYNDCMWMVKSVFENMTVSYKFINNFLQLINASKHYGVADACSWVRMVLAEWEPKKICKAILLAACSEE